MHPFARSSFVAGILPRATRRRALQAGLALFAGLALPAAAHDYKIGALRIEHPYATPSPAGARNGAVYLRLLRNTGDQPDRLVGARTPVAAAVEIHRSAVDANQVMRMRAVDGIDLPPRSERALRHGGEYHLMLIDLKAPLQEGERFEITLRFEKAGEREVKVWVQQPRDASAAGAHKH